MYMKKSSIERYLEASKVCNDINEMYYYQKNQMAEELRQRQALEKMMSEFISKINVVIEQEAINKLSEMINNLAN